MKVTLVGPDDLGFWFIHDENGNSFTFVERHEDHPAAAASLGWKPPTGVTDEDELINAAIDWFTDHSGEDFKAPQHVVQYFEQLYKDFEEE